MPETVVFGVTEVPGRRANPRVADALREQGGEGGYHAVVRSG